MVKTQGVRFEHSALHQADSAGTRPSHAFEKSAAVDSVIIVVVLDVAAGAWIDQFRFRHCCLLLFACLICLFQAARGQPEA
jgi:hypothetical protein